MQCDFAVLEFKKKHFMNIESVLNVNVNAKNVHRQNSSFDILKVIFNKISYA